MQNNNNKRTHESQSAGSIIPMHLRNHTNETVSVKVDNPKSPAQINADNRKKIGLLKNQPIGRSSRLLFNTEPLQPVKAFYPVIDNEAINASMINYRAYITADNERIKTANFPIIEYNKTVIEFCKNNELTDAQKKYSKLFLAYNKEKEIKVYNELVIDFNKLHGNIVKQKRFPTTKPLTESIFMQMLYLYSKQLEKFTNEYLKLTVNEAVTIKPFTVNAFHLSQMTREGGFAIDLCTKTFRNHREALERAGVLTHYNLKGRLKGVEMHINPQILVVFDLKTQKLTTAENQAFNLSKKKELPHNDEVTRTLKNNIKKRENGQADFLVKGTASPDFSFVFYKNTPEQSSKSQLGGARENVKVLKTLSDKLEARILNDQDFAERLTAGEYHNYKRLDKRCLYEESINGTLTREEFKTLIIQEFFKNAAKLYRGKTPFIGSWKKAINAYTEKLFIVKNGGGINDTWLVKKELMVDMLDAMLWRINNAHKWFLKTKINPLYPSDYFDFTRTDKKEIGFEYTKKAYQNHLKYIENKPKLAQAVVKKSTIRKQRINHSAKFDLKINAFFKNRIELNELIDYVNDNLPANYMQKLSDTLTKVDATKYDC